MFRFIAFCSRFELKMQIKKGFKATVPVENVIAYLPNSKREKKGTLRGEIWTSEIFLLADKYVGSV